MAGVSTEQGDSLNVELNLVPFIDLLSSLVLFLLITAVWIQIASVPVGADAKGSTAIANPVEGMLAVRVTPTGYELDWPAALSGETSLPRTLARQNGRYDTEALTAVLSKIDPKQVTGAAVAAEDDVGYGLVIQALDIMKKAGLNGVSLSVN